MISWCTTHNEPEGQHGGIMIPCEHVEVATEDEGRVAYARRWKRKPDPFIKVGDLWTPNPEYLA